MEKTTSLPAVDDEDHTRGPDDAPVTLVEYGDFQCPACGSAFPVIEELVDRMGDELRFVFRHFPLDDMHPRAVPAALAAEAAADGGRFWEMHRTLYANQDRLADDDLAGYAADLGVPADDPDDGDHLARVERDLASGEDAGVPGTPALFVNGRLHDGPVDLDTLVDVVTRAARG